MAVDYYLPDTVRDRIALLAPDERAELLALLDRLLADPEPDGVTKVRMPRHFPYTDRHMEARLGKYRICYQYAGPDNRAVLYIFAIEPLPPLRRG